MKQINQINQITVTHNGDEAIFKNNQWTGCRRIVKAINRICYDQSNSIVLSEIEKLLKAQFPKIQIVKLFSTNLVVFNYNKDEIARIS